MKNFNHYFCVGLYESADVDLRKKDIEDFNSVHTYVGHALHANYTAHV